MLDQTTSLRRVNARALPCKSPLHAIAPSFGRPAPAAQHYTLLGRRGHPAPLPGGCWHYRALPPEAPGPVRRLAYAAQAVALPPLSPLITTHTTYTYARTHAHYTRAHARTHAQAGTTVVGELVYSRRQHKSATDAAATAVHFFLDGLQSFLFGLLLTQTFKVAVGRPRPGFLNICNPVVPNGTAVPDVQYNANQARLGGRLRPGHGPCPHLPSPSPLCWPAGQLFPLCQRLQRLPQELPLR